ncbi:MAG: hypothetical protein EBW58_11275 [Betaproteobacteria bacterium]|nr:hypothetical protein [Betaproteobacteria bacterium]
MELAMKTVFRIAALAFAVAAIFTLPACSNSDDDEITVSSLRLIGQQVLPRRLEFQGTTVGGLSGIDYDPVNNRYVLISDDRTTTDSAQAPRMYTAQLTFDANGFTGVQFLSTFAMKQPSGAVYPKVPDPLVADPEAVRIAATAKASAAIRNTVFIASSMVDLVEEHYVNHVTVQ